MLIELAMKKLLVAADELSTRWKWAEAMVDVDWSATARFGRIHSEPDEPTDTEKTEIERFRIRHDELANLDEEDWTDTLVEEAEGIEARLDAIEAVFRHAVGLTGWLASNSNDSLQMGKSFQYAVRVYVCGVRSCHPILFVVSPFERRFLVTECKYEISILVVLGSRWPNHHSEEYVLGGSGLQGSLYRFCMTAAEKAAFQCHVTDAQFVLFKFEYLIAERD